MALPTGAIGASDINVELARPATNLLTMDETPVRTLAQVPSGTISFQNLQGKSSGPVRKTINVPLSGDQYNITITSSYPAIAPEYVAGTSDIVLQVAPGAVIGSGGPGAYAMTISGFNPEDTLVLNNQGYIVGSGGYGGGGGSGAGNPTTPYGGGGQPGGHALNVAGIQTPNISINNQGVIGGGGGGGGGGAGATSTNPRPSRQGGPYNYGVGGGGGGQGGGRIGYDLLYGGPGGGGSPYRYGTTGGGGAGGPLGNGGGGGGPSPRGPGGGGGAGGNYINTQGKSVVWINTGQLYGGAT